VYISLRTIYHTIFFQYHSVLTAQFPLYMTAAYKYSILFYVYTRSQCRE